MTTESQIAATLARYKQFLAAAEAGDVHASINADAYAARLKRMGAIIPGEAGPVAVAAPAPKPNRTPKQKPALSREEAIERIAAAHDIPETMTAAALADGTTAADFALAVAEHVEIERVARRIVEA